MTPIVSQKLELQIQMKIQTFVQKCYEQYLDFFLNLSYLNDDIMLRYLNFGALL